MVQELQYENNCWRKRLAQAEQAMTRYAGHGDDSPVSKENDVITTKIRTMRQSDRFSDSAKLDTQASVESSDAAASSERDETKTEPQYNLSDGCLSSMRRPGAGGGSGVAPAAARSLMTSSPKPIDNLQRVNISSKRHVIGRTVDQIAVPTNNSRAAAGGGSVCGCESSSSSSSAAVSSLTGRRSTALNRQCTAKITAFDLRSANDSGINVSSCSPSPHKTPASVSSCSPSPHKTPAPRLQADSAVSSCSPSPHKTPALSMQANTVSSYTDDDVKLCPDSTGAEDNALCKDSRSSRLESSPGVTAGQCDGQNQSAMLIATHTVNKRVSYEINI